MPDAAPDIKIEVAIGLPPSPRDESAQLRRDIADELADHLACAMQRELRRTDDAAAARQAVLDRFGNPSRVARRLWLDAMKESIMNQRLTLVTNMVLAIACIAVVVLVWAAMRQDAAVNQQMLAKLTALSMLDRGDRGGGDQSMWTEITVPVRRGRADGAPVADAHVQLAGKAFNSGDYEYLDQTTGADGNASFGPIQPGRYALNMAVPDGLLYVNHGVILYPGRRELDPIILPEHVAAPAPVSMRLNLPDDLKDREVYVACNFVPWSEPLRQRNRQQQGQHSAFWSWTSQLVVIDQRGRAAIIPAERQGDSWWHAIRIDRETLRLADRVELDSKRQYELVDAVAYVPQQDPDDPSRTVLVAIDRQLIATGARGRSGAVSPEAQQTVIQEEFSLEAGRANAWSIRLAESMIKAIHDRVVESEQQGETESKADG